MKILKNYPERIPIVIERENTVNIGNLMQNLPELIHNKYIVSRGHTLSQFQAMIRVKLKLYPSQALYLVFSSNKLYGGGIFI